MKLLKNICLVLLLCPLFIAGIVFNITWCMNILTFLVWIFFISSLITIIGGKIDVIKKYNKNNTKIAVIINNIMYSSFVILLVAYGHFLLGSLLLISIIISLAIYKIAYNNT